jgi:NAD(P)H-hydrate epimerase
MQKTGPNLFQMMENAGRNLAGLSMELLGNSWQQASYLVLAGSGGNGGRAICACRHLANHGCRVSLCLADPVHLGEAPAFQYKVFQSTSGKEIRTAELDRQHPDIFLDALGLKSAPVREAVRLIELANASGAPLALDIPSRRNATTGEAMGACIWPRWTMTLALPKMGLLPDTTGDLFLADIGIPQETYQSTQTVTGRAWRLRRPRLKLRKCLAQERSNGNENC